MISRYKRKPVSQILQIHQTRSVSAQSDSPPDRADNVPTSHGGDRRVDRSERESNSDVSENSGLQSNDPEASWSEFQSCTGLSTDNSSVISWGFEEFDQAATRQVQKIFKQIDECLYEQKGGTLVEGLQEECRQWMLFFPHLRIQGRQIVTPAEDGFSWYPGRPSEIASSAGYTSAHAKDQTELGIFGTKLSLSTTSDAGAPVSFSLCDEDDDDDDDDGVGVIMSDGIMEEYLAFDSRDKDDELFEWNRVMSLDSLRMGYPPISPQYCKKEAVLACLFDHVWKEVVGCLEELICRHWEESIADDDRNDIAIKTSRAGILNPHAALQRLPLVLPPVTYSRIPPISPNVGNRSQGGSMISQRNLNDLITIHGIPLQQRNLHLMDKVLDCDDKSPMRPTSSSVISGKPRPGRASEHSSSSLSHNVPSARRRNPPRTLHPISNNPNISRSGTPKIEEVIRGTRIQTGNEVPCSPLSFNRNHLLPPIGTSDAEYHYPPGSRRQTPDHTRGRSPANLELSNPLRYRRGSDGTDCVSIGVTGVALSSLSAASWHWGHPVYEKKLSDREEVHSGIHLTQKSQSRRGARAKSRQGL